MWTPSTTDIRRAAEGVEKLCAARNWEEAEQGEGGVVYRKLVEILNRFGERGRVFTSPDDPNR